MKVTHFLNEKDRRSREVKEECGFMLSNKEGDYLWLNDIPKSRYEGWFSLFDDNIYRILESIEVEGAEEVSEVVNKFHYVERKRGDLRELFYLPQSSHTLVYELNEKRRINVFFDMRESYSHAGAVGYDVERREDVFLVRFHNGLVLAIRCEGGEVVRDEFRRNYPFDRKRNSFPDFRDVSRGLSLFGKRFIFSVTRDENVSLKEVNKLFVRNTVRRKGELDVLCAQNSLHGLLVLGKPGVYAGLPWFFQFWPRDEAISLKSLLDLEEEKAKKIFFRLLHDGMKEGPGGVVNADAPGWIFKRAEDILPLLGEEGRGLVHARLTDRIKELLMGSTEGGLAVNRSGETWMDSLKRKGARIEIQAMRLNMYRLAAQLSRGWKERRFYRGLEKEMRERVRKTFFDGDRLHDGYDISLRSPDAVVRPNIFIAAYIYPDLLSSREWERCFDDALLHLWLPWGGLSTLQKESPQFHREHTGENSKSYHRGDSWFFLNSLAAIVLYRCNKKKYLSYIEKLMESGKEELMWKGIAGAHGELSSAGDLYSEGCPNQAWSNAMYLEARKEIK